MIHVMNVFFFIVSSLLFLLAFLWVMMSDPIKNMKNWARRIPVLMTSIHAGIWINNPNNNACVIYFFLWLGITLMEFLPSEKDA